MSKYTDYTIEELLEDREFVRTVKSIRTNDEWEQFLQLHSGLEEKINRARKIIKLFETTEGKLRDEKKYKLWKSISSFNSEFKHTVKLPKIKPFTKIAASVLILLSLGYVFYLSQKNQGEQYQFTQNVKKTDETNPVLVLSNGEKLELKKDDSKIAVLKDQDAIQINNDSIVKLGQPAHKEDIKSALNEVIIPFGKKSSLVLEDGTKVWLNAGSRFAFPQKFTGRKREVFLEGEAYFEVAKNEGKPFIVNANDINIEVLGTKFNVSAYFSDSFCETVLLEGQVNVWEKNKLFREKIQMAPNQKATFDRTKKSIELAHELHPELNIAWTEGWYPFSHENLEVVLNKLERYYNVSFEYDKSLILNTLPVTGKLDLKDSLGDVLHVLSGVAKVNFEISDQKVILLNK